MSQNSTAPAAGQESSLQLPEDGVLKLETPGYFTEISHDPGMPGTGVSWHNVLTQPHRTCVIEAQGQSEFLNAQIPLAGSFCMETTDEMEVSNANVGLTRSRESFAFYRLKEGKTYRLFNVRADIDTIANWFGGKLPAPLRPYLAETPDKSLHCPTDLPWALRETLKLALSYDMPLRRQATEAVSLQIMTHMLHRLCDSAAMERGLSSFEQKAAYEAHAILMNNLARPPLTAELARQVKLSTRRLELAFREVFGMTLFEAADKARFDTACQALSKGMPIKAVAHDLGYASVSSFTYAFRRRFGEPPGQWLLAKNKKK